jgi:hypothetical protein
LWTLAARWSGDFQVSARAALGRGEPCSASYEIVSDDRATIPCATAGAGRVVSALHPAPRCAPREPVSFHGCGPCPATEADTRVERKDHAIRAVKKVVSVGATVILAAGAVTVGRWLGTRPDGRMAQLLASPSAIERWTSELAGRQARQGEESKPPLVVQAEALAAYLNPPAPPKRAASSPAPARPRPAPVEAKPVAVAAPALRLIGISYHCSNPAESRALVWESADRQRWVRPGMQVGHILIERINPGSILCRDAGGTREVGNGRGHILNYKLFVDTP